MNAILENNLQGIGVIQAYTAEGHQEGRITRQSGEYRDAAVRAAVVRAKFVPMLYVIAGLAFALLITVGGWLTFAGHGPTLGNYVVFILFAMRLIMPLFILGMLLNQIQRSEAAAKRIDDVLSVRPEVRDAPDAVDLGRRPREVAFDDVHFAYRGRAPVLNGVSFRIQEGQVLGVVGPTGAGKSTLIKLLLRYYTPQRGRVTVDGLPIERIRLGSLRRHIGYVSQEAFLFSGTVAENIRLGSPEASDEEVRRAARIAGASEFIDSLPQGYDTVVGERGLKLSGGQRQRVSLARAVLRDPALLILDEATSAVDTRTEELIQRNLHQFRKGRITLAIAHRLSTIRQADWILVVVDGVVVEEGDHETLVAKGGVYADLWRVQSGQMARGEGVYGEPTAALGKPAA
jgi:ATP-binding cassette, subfamily B, bacterial